MPAHASLKSAAYADLPAQGAIAGLRIGAYAHLGILKWILAQASFTYFVFLSIPPSTLQSL
jgi:hypothetical protein